MERLAEKLKDILNEQDFCFEPWEIKVVEKALNRFAAYENTGQEPEEIKAIVGLASENCAKTADAIDKLLQDDAELKSYRELGPIDRLRELAQADRKGRCVVLDGKSRDKELIRKLVRLLYWLEDCIKKKDFSPFRIVAGAPENNYPFISAFQHIENEYELEIYLAGKDEEAQVALRRKRNDRVHRAGSRYSNSW